MFEDVVGSVFSVMATASTASTRLKLVLVSEPKSKDTQLEQYTLVFRGSTAPRLSQGSYEVSHKTLGRLCLFLVPGAQDRSSATYTASFSFLQV